MGLAVESCGQIWLPYVGNNTYTNLLLFQGQVIPGGGQPGQTVIFRQPHAQPPPKDYTVLAILVTVCCCLPFGIVGIIKALDVSYLC